MKKIVTIALLFCCTASFANNAEINITQVRALYQKAVKDENSCRTLIGILTPYTERNNPLLSGYRASATMLMAKHLFSPFSKMSWFKKGRHLLEKSIEVDTQNIELRFLRFAAQTNIPSFLGYNGNIKSDKEFIINTYSKINDRNFKEFVFPVLNKSKYITPIEKQRLEK